MRPAPQISRKPVSYSTRLTRASPAHPRDLYFDLYDGGPTPSP
jgi:hypothetical protein